MNKFFTSNFNLFLTFSPPPKLAVPIENCQTYFPVCSEIFLLPWHLSVWWHNQPAPSCQPILIGSTCVAAPDTPR